jgi:AraC-like DNA-binding protein
MHESLSSENLQRVGFLAFLPAILRKFGVDATEVLTESALSPEALNDPNGAIPFAAMGRLAQIAAAKARCPHLGLEIGAQVKTTSLGLVGELMRNAPTLGAALLDFAAHQHRNAHGGVVYLLTDADNASFGYALYESSVPGYHLICDGAANGVFTLVRELVADMPVTEVLLSRSEPADLAPYHSALGVKLRFNAAQTAVVFPRKLLDQPVGGADRALYKVLEERVRDVWHAGDLDPVTHLRRVLRIALLRGPISADGIAAQMGLSRRTLHRRLEKHGLQFQDVLDETRHEFARQLLANTRLGIGEIGAIVGFEDRSVFSRGFSRWAGVTPGKWRLNLHAAVPNAKLQST